LLIVELSQNEDHLSTSSLPGTSTCTPTTALSIVLETLYVIFEIGAILVGKSQNELYALHIKDTTFHIERVDLNLNYRPFHLQN
jgi:hypothetical protein